MEMATIVISLAMISITAISHFLVLFQHHLMIATLKEQVSEPQ